ncbi:MAG: FkbM family methyltransferase [Acidaminococcaceae bacterium]|nr:FkbM family methyltransferase [Acidaminococcaceae bacterium]
MLPFIKETNTVWEYLKTAKKPVVLYGTGDGADKILARLAAEGITVSAVFASDEFVRGQQFHGFTVRRYSELLSLKENVIVLIAFASQLPEMLERFQDLEQVHETYAPHVPIFNGDETVTPEWIGKYAEELQAVYDRLADEESRKVFADILNYRISGKISYLRDCTTMRENDLRKIFSFGDEETYVDAGAYDGDTIEEFLQLTGHRYKKIYAVEPDPKNFKKLMEFVRQNDLDYMECIPGCLWRECGVLELTGNGGRQSTLWSAEKEEDEAGKPAADTVSGLLANCADTIRTSKINMTVEGVNDRGLRRKKQRKNPVQVVSVDSILGTDHASYMKFDVEGVEKEALEGAKEHLVPDREGNLPKLFIAAYHHDEDLFTLPLLLWKLQPRYRIYLRKHPYVPDWEINIFAK